MSDQHFQDIKEINSGSQVRSDAEFLTVQSNGIEGNEALVLVKSSIEKVVAALKKAGMLDDLAEFVANVEAVEDGLKVTFGNGNFTTIPLSNGLAFDSMEYDAETGYLHILSDGDDVVDPVYIPAGVTGADGQDGASAYEIAVAHGYSGTEEEWLASLKNAYRTASIPFGVVDNTSTATVFTATVQGITELRDGVCAYIRNGTVTSAAGCTLNVNNLGAKPIYSTVSAATAVTTTFNVSYTMLFIYNSTRVSGGCWDMYYGYDANTTYTPVKLGFGYTTCSTAAATAAKTASLSSYALNTGGIVAVKFTNAVPANATLNINSKGAKAIYYKGAAITAGVIKAGDTVTFMYSTQYHVLSIDRDEAPVTSVDGETGDIWLGNKYLGLTDTAAFESLLENARATTIPITVVSDSVVMPNSNPMTLYEIFTSSQKVIFATVVPDMDGEEVVWIPDGRVFEMDSQDPSTGQLDLHCIKAGVLYQITMNYNGTQYAGTITQTNLALPSAQGVSF